jgi:hypothetical protein
MSAHTPGPWRLTPWYDDRGRTSRNKWQGIYEPIPGQALGSKSIVLGWGAKGEVEDVWVSMSEANARLIAAAPETAAERDRLRDVNEELLAALREIVCIGYLDFGQACASRMFVCARAAIEKAEGRT